nr:phosphatidylcholine:ceramide cholinephosphotransferase 2-like [Salvelinus alpinus]
MLLVGIWVIQWLFLRYKSIAGRRFFFLIGTLYLYRCVTMYITTLPVPGNHFTCAPKLYGDSHAKMQRVLTLISGGGLSITGSHLMCGDFLYSGHTVMLTLTYLFIKEYSPRTFWWYHLMCWLLAAVGVVCILVAHEHYSVDVVVAYFITSASSGGTTPWPTSRPCGARPTTTSPTPGGTPCSTSLRGTCRPRCPAPSAGQSPGPLPALRIPVRSTVQCRACGRSRE